MPARMFCWRGLVRCGVIGAVEVGGGCVEGVGVGGGCVVRVGVGGGRVERVGVGGVERVGTRRMVDAWIGALPRRDFREKKIIFHR